MRMWDSIYGNIAARVASRAEDSYWNIILNVYAKKEK